MFPNGHDLARTGTARTKRARRARNESIQRHGDSIRPAPRRIADALLTRNRRQARALEPALEEIESLVVPAVSVYDVFEVLLREAGEEAAIQGVAAMQRGRIVDLTVQRALDAVARAVSHQRRRSSRAARNAATGRTSMPSSVRCGRSPR